MLQPTMQLRWLTGIPAVHPKSNYEVPIIDSYRLQQKWEHPNNVDDEGFPHLGEWRDIGVERE